MTGVEVLTAQLLASQGGVLALSISIITAIATGIAVRWLLGYLMN